MTREETLQVLSVLKAAYPNFYKGMRKEEAESAVALWASMFAEDEAAMVAAAVKTLIATDIKGFPPHIGAVKEKLRKLSCPESMTEAEAWSLVYKAIQRGLYNSKEEYEKLSSVLQRLVGGHSQLREWAMMDADTVQSVVASNFQRSFRARQESERELALMPPEIRSMLGELSKRFMLEGSESWTQGPERDEQEEATC